MREMVGPCGLEPQTSTVSRWRSSQLSYGPIGWHHLSTAALRLSRLWRLSGFR